jgi:rfaE bifunctional protein nucleotidyltransferase chain/domain
MNDSPTIYEWTPAGPRPLDALLAELAPRRAAGQRLVTTNGCFDLVHVGHVEFLAAARAQGDMLVVGINGDAAVRRLKGAGRPLIGERERAELLAALRPVDHVVVFEDLLPNQLLARLRPDVHCKAGDYTVETLPETAIVRAGGGEVRILPLTAGHSTSRLVERILAAQQPESAPADQADADLRAVMVERLMDGANALRQSAYALREPLAAAAERIAAALRAGGRAYLDKPLAPLLPAAWLGATPAEARPGDVLLLAPGLVPAADTAGLLAAAHAQGVITVGVADGRTALGASPPDIVLRVPTDDLRLAGPAQLAALNILIELVDRLIE